MERCTGRFFSRMKMTMPKPRPKTQNSSPIISRRCPSMPRNETDERAGSFKAASPPASEVCSAGCATAQPAVRRSRVTSVAEAFAMRLFTIQHPTDARLAFQVGIKILLSILGLQRVILFRDVNRPLEDSIRQGYGCHRSSEHAPNTLPPPYQNKEECRFGRVGKLAYRHIVPRSDYTPLHKALVYSILPEVGSMTVSK